MPDWLIFSLWALVASAGNPPPPTFTVDDVEIIADVVCWEARGESFADQRDVAYAVANRVYAGSFGRSVSDVVHARGQFSGFTSGQRRGECRRDGEPFRRAMFAATLAVSSDYWNHGATHFAVCRLGPVFGPKFKLVRRHKGHCFYKLV